MNKTKEAWLKASRMDVETNFLLGPINSETLIRDPKHLLFTLSRYKFSAKMLYGANHIIEIGCGEGIGSLMFLAETSAKVTAIDFDEKQISYARTYVLCHGRERLSFYCADLVSS